MNTYEALIVFKPVLDVENTELVIKNAESSIQNLKGKILKIERVGRKRLAYEISKFKDGFIATLWFELDPAAVADFKKYCQLSEDILRLTLIRLDNFNLATVGTTTTAVHAGSGREKEFHPREHHHRGGGDRHEHRGGFQDRGGFNDRGPSDRGPGGGGEHRPPQENREFRGGGDREHHRDRG